MIKVMWFLKRAEHLSLAEFKAWWLESHIHLIVGLQGPHLKRYVVNVRTEDDTLPAGPDHLFDWDGCAEQWFENEDAYRAAYVTDTPSPSRADTLKHTSRFARMVVEEREIAVGTG